MGRSKGLKQAYRLRDIASALVDEVFAATDFTPQLAQKSKAIADSIRAWAEADEHIRIHRGKPLPTQASWAARRKPPRGNRRIARDALPASMIVDESAPSHGPISQEPDAARASTVQEETSASAAPDGRISQGASPAQADAQADA